MADKVQTQVWLMRETRDALKKVSIKEGVSMAQIVEEALQIVLPQTTNRHRGPYQTDAGSQQVNNMTGLGVVGIDPGLSGAIAHMYDGVIITADMPIFQVVKAKKKQREVDTVQLATIIANFNPAIL